MQKISFTLAMLALVLVVGFAVSATFVSCDNESVWLLTDERPSHISTLRNVEILSAGPFTLTFDEEKRGPRVFYAARWLGPKKQRGPWSDIESAVVP